MEGENGTVNSDQTHPSLDRSFPSRSLRSRNRGTFFFSSSLSRACVFVWLFTFVFLPSLKCRSRSFGPCFQKSKARSVMRRRRGSLWCKNFQKKTPTRRRYGRPPRRRYSDHPSSFSLPPRLPWERRELLSLSFECFVLERESV